MCVRVFTKCLFFRLGSSAMTADSKVPRITRSQAEGRSEAGSGGTGRGGGEGESKGKTEKSELVGKVTRKEDKGEESPRIPRPVRLVRQKLNGKVLVRKVVRVTREGKRLILIHFSQYLHCF